MNKQSEIIRVLLVEDDPGETELISDMLSGPGEVTFDLECVDRLSKGLECLAAGGIDVVLLDLGLPYSQGLDTFTRVYAQASEVPIVVLTGLYDVTLAIKAVREGAQDYLVKSQVDSKLLVRSLHYAIERHRVEKKLRESERRFRGIVEKTQAGYFCIVRSGRYQHVNNAWLRMHGYTSPDEVIGQHFTITHIEAERGRVQRITEKLLHGEPIPTAEFTRLCKDGSIGYHTFSAIPVMRSGEIVGVEGFLIDITERKRAEDELSLSYEKLRNLAGHLQSIREEERTCIAREIHDELGQALTALKMDTSWLSSRLAKDEKSLFEKTRSMLDLIDMTIKTVKRMSTELRPGLLDDLGLAAAIEWQAEEFQNRTGCKCEVIIDPDDIALDDDRSTAIFRIFQEALTNVARHADATMVKVSLIEKAGKLVLEVRDNGCGITQEQISDPRSFGLIGIRERVHPWRGEVKMEGVRNKGTAVTVTILLNSK